MKRTLIGLATVVVSGAILVLLFYLWHRGDSGVPAIVPIGLVVLGLIGAGLAQKELPRWTEVTLNIMLKPFAYFIIAGMILLALSLLLYTLMGGHPLWGNP